MIPCDLQALFHNVALLRAAVREPSSCKRLSEQIECDEMWIARTKREDRDLEPCRSKVAEDLCRVSAAGSILSCDRIAYHIFGLIFGFNGHYECVMVGEATQDGYI